MDVTSLILEGKFTDPHEFLGLNSSEEGALIRIWRPENSSCTLKIGKEIVEANPIDDSGLFVCRLQSQIQPHEYWISHHDGTWANDPYAFDRVIGQLDEHLLGRGVHYELYDLLGATPKVHQGVAGMSFAVWAPNAASVLLKAEFNGFNGKRNPMRAIGATGVWELFVPGVKKGQKYLFEVITKEGEQFVKVDPVAHHAELRPSKTSIAFDVGNYAWNDQKWLEKKGQFRSRNIPINIYEVHLGSWEQEEGTFLNYRELAQKLSSYCKQMHYTHVELMGICEHPLDESWGYQVTGYFAPTSRHGTPEDFQFLVDHLHQEEIGVILDWVPAHFPTDPHSLCRFDGTYLYEHMDPRKGYHPHWNTHIFNYGRWEVSNFLIASALFWLEKMHVDGLRVDAVASMIYLDYGRGPGEWIPNSMGTNINLEALEFMKHLNSIIHERIPDALMIAEESTAFPGITKDVKRDGLGFDLKWNLGWMNDTLRFFSAPFSERSGQLSGLTFAREYAFNEKFALVLSHDEVVHGKRSLLSKMPGILEQQFAGLRNLYGFFMTFPGKKLLFMGSEWGQPSEWNCKEKLPWELSKQGLHKGLHQMVASLNAFYTENGALFERDQDRSSFEWIVQSDQESLVIAFLRKGEEQTLLCVHHLGEHPIESYTIPIQGVKGAKEVFNTDSEQWGGSGRMNPSVKVNQTEIELQLAPLATHLFEMTFDRDDS